MSAIASIRISKSRFKRIAEIRARIAAERAQGKAIGYLSIPISSAGGGYDKVNGQVAKEYVAIITDGKGDIPNGTKIPVPNYKLKWDEGNPTGHGIIFIGLQGQVYCYVVPGGV